MRQFISILFCFFIFVAHAQIFSSTLGGTIPDNLTFGKIFLMPVSSPATRIDSTFGLKRIMIDIEHRRIQDISVSLISPDGTQIQLTTGAGGINGQNYDSTFFSMKALRSTLMSQAPFRDTFFPRQNIGFLNNGQNLNGNWRLWVIDALPNDSGTLISWNLYFDSLAPAPNLIQNSSCNLFNAGGCICSDSFLTKDCMLLPDMIVSKNWFTDSALGVNHFEEFAGTVNVSNMVANIGEGPLEFVGTGQWYCGDSLVSGSGKCPDSMYSKQTVKQRIYIKNRFGFFDYKDSLVGLMGFHSELGHQHLHIDNITENSLRIKGPQTDPRLWPIVAKGNKVSINMYDHVSCNHFDACEWNGQLIRPNMLPNAGLGAQYGATNLSIQGISVGFADLYEYNLPGQNIPLDTNVCNGDYVLVGQYDPKKAFIDKNSDNNIIWGKVTLTKQKPNCCQTAFSIDTLNLDSLTFQFIDRSMAMPQSWHWDFGDGDTSTLQFPTHRYQSSGTKTVHLKTTTAQGCSAERIYNFQVILGEKKIAKDFLSVAIYPNPTKDIFNFDLKSDTKLAASLIDLQGRTLWQQDIASIETKFSISVKEAGVYLLLLKSNTQSTYYKLIKQ